MSKNNKRTSFEKDSNGEFAELFLKVRDYIINETLIKLIEYKELMKIKNNFESA